MTVYTNDVSAANPDADTIRENNRDFENVINGGLKASHFSSSRKMVLVPITVSMSITFGNSGFEFKMRRAGVIRNIWLFTDDNYPNTEAQLQIGGTQKWTSGTLSGSGDEEESNGLNIAYSANDVVTLIVNPTISGVINALTWYIETMEVTDR